MSSSTDPNYATPATDVAGKPAPHPKRAAHLAIFLTVLIDLIGFGILIPILQPLAKDQFGAPDLVAQWLMGIYSLMQFVFSPILGRVSDRVGRRPVIIASLIGSMLGYLIIALAASEKLGLSGAWSIGLLFLARIVTGVCGASIATAQAYLADITAPEKRAGVMGMIGAAFGIGFVLGPVIGGLTSHTAAGPALPFFIAAAMSLGNAYYCWKKLPESLPPEKRGEPRPHSTIRATMRKMGHTAFPVVLTGNFLLITAFSMMTATFVLFTGESFGFRQRENGLAFGFIGIIAVFIQGGLIRRIAKNGNERNLALAGCVCMVVALATLPWTSPWVTLMLNMALMSVGNSLATPTVNTLASQCGTVQNQGETMGAMSGAGSLGRFLGPFIAGTLLWLFPGKYDYAFWVSAAVMAVATVTLAKIRPVVPGKITVE
ncbi:MAG TPA: MFS transporter [Verrucomicrobiales bacterium]|jgi:DHA1 family tetracycline resistance protein-like MFS transporter|nr:MFS transporter [Verrucomicrobiales bacterium]